MKRFTALLIILSIILNMNLDSNANTNANELESFNSRNIFKTTFSGGVGIPSFFHIKYSNMFSNNVSGGISLGSIFVGTSFSLDFRYYFNDIDYYSSWYSETNFTYVATSAQYSDIIAPSQKIGYEYRSDNGFTFNINGGLGLYMLSYGTNLLPVVDILFGHSY